MGRRKHLLEDAADELAKATGRRPLILAEDITDRDAPGRIKAAVLETFGRVDILINNAGGSRPVKAGFGTPEEWEEGMRLNFDAGRNLAHTLVDLDASAEIWSDYQPNRYPRATRIQCGDTAKQCGHHLV